MPLAWAVPRQRAAEGLRADWITRFRGRDEKAGITYADFGNEVLVGQAINDFGNPLLLIEARLREGNSGGR
jgi:hypothetical protein